MTEKDLEDFSKIFDEFIKGAQEIQLEFQKEILKESIKKSKSLTKRIKELKEKVKAKEISKEDQVEFTKEFMGILSEYHQGISEYQGFQGFSNEIIEKLMKNWQKVSHKIQNFLNNHARSLEIKDWSYQSTPGAIISTIKVNFKPN